MPKIIISLFTFNTPEYLTNSSSSGVSASYNFIYYPTPTFFQMIILVRKENFLEKSKKKIWKQDVRKKIYYLSIKTLIKRISQQKKVNLFMLENLTWWKSDILFLPLVHAEDIPTHTKEIKRLWKRNTEGILQ